MIKKIASVNSGTIDEIQDGDEVSFYIDNYGNRDSGIVHGAVYKDSKGVPMICIKCKSTNRFLQRNLDSVMLEKKGTAPKSGNPSAQTDPVSQAAPGARAETASQFPSSEVAMQAGDRVEIIENRSSRRETGFLVSIDDELVGVRFDSNRQLEEIFKLSDIKINPLPSTHSDNVLRQGTRVQCGDGGKGTVVAVDGDNVEIALDDAADFSALYDKSQINIEPIPLDPSKLSTTRSFGFSFRTLTGYSGMIFDEAIVNGAKSVTKLIDEKFPRIKDEKGRELERRYVFAGQEFLPGYDLNHPTYKFFREEGGPLYAIDIPRPDLSDFRPGGELKDLYGKAKSVRDRADRSYHRINFKQIKSTVEAFDRIEDIAPGSLEKEPFRTLKNDWDRRLAFVFSHAILREGIPEVGEAISAILKGDYNGDAKAAADLLVQFETFVFDKADLTGLIIDHGKSLGLKLDEPPCEHQRASLRAYTVENMQSIIFTYRSILRSVDRELSQSAQSGPAIPAQAAPAPQRAAAAANSANSVSDALLTETGLKQGDLVDVTKTVSGRRTQGNVTTTERGTVTRINGDTVFIRIGADNPTETAYSRSRDQIMLVKLDPNELRSTQKISFRCVMDGERGEQLRDILIPKGGQSIIDAVNSVFPLQQAHDGTDLKRSYFLRGPGAGSGEIGHRIVPGQDPNRGRIQHMKHMDSIVEVVDRDPRDLYELENELMMKALELNSLVERADRSLLRMGADDIKQSFQVLKTIKEIFPNALTKDPLKALVKDWEPRLVLVFANSFLNKAMPAVSEAIRLILNNEFTENTDVSRALLRKFNDTAPQEAILLREIRDYMDNEAFDMSCLGMSKGNFLGEVQRELSVKLKSYGEILRAIV